MIPGSIRWFHITIHIQVSSAETAVTTTKQIAFCGKLNLEPSLGHFRQFMKLFCKGSPGRLRPVFVLDSSH